jgi:hypothetical protein
MWVYAAWGLAGGLAIEGAEFIQAKPSNDMPWASFGWVIYIVRIVIRMALGACVAAALGSSGEITNSSMALISGAGAPLFLEKALQVTRTVFPGGRGQELRQSSHPHTSSEAIHIPTKPDHVV